MKGERVLRGRQESGRVKNLTRGYSQAWIFHQHYLISEDSLIKRASPISELFHLVVGKNSLPPKESFKASSIRITTVARFQRQGGQPWVVGSSLLDK